MKGDICASCPPWLQCHHRCIVPRKSWIARPKASWHTHRAPIPRLHPRRIRHGQPGKAPRDNALHTESELSPQDTHGSHGPDEKDTQKESGSNGYPTECLHALIDESAASSFPNGSSPGHGREPYHYGMGPSPPSLYAAQRDRAAPGAPIDSGSRLNTLCHYPQHQEQNTT